MTNPNPEWQRIQEAAAYADLRAMANSMRTSLDYVTLPLLCRLWADRIDAALTTLGKEAR